MFFRRRIHTNRLLTLVRQKDYDGASNYFLHADTSEIQSATSQDKQAMSDFMSKLGVDLARKGDKTQVKTKILPILSALGTLNPQLEWELEPGKLDIIEQDAFETDDAYDYPTTSTMTTTTTTTTTTSSPTLTALHDLISNLSTQNYYTARNLLLELQQLSFPIPPSTQFILPASFALTLPSAEQLGDFKLWFSLYPPREINPTPYPNFLELCGNSSLLFYTTFSLLLASKGYSAFSNNNLLPSIFRYSHQSAFLSFYSQYEQAIETYFKSLHPFMPLLLRAQIEYARSTAILFLAEAGHLTDALALFDFTDKYHPKTYSLLLYRLRSSSIVDKDRYIKHLQQIVKPSSSPHILHTSSGFAQTLRYLSRALASPNTHYYPSTKVLVNFLLSYISLRSQTNFNGPNAITLLYTHTLRFSPNSYRAISHLLFAHMVLLFRLGTLRIKSQSSGGPPSLHALLRLFNTFFHLQGIPTSLFLARLQDSDLGNFYFRSLSTILPTTLPKLFPNRLHISIVWQSLAYLAPDHSQLVILWEELIKFASKETGEHDLQTPKSWTSRGHRLDDPSSTCSSLTWPTTSHASPIIAETFTPFILKLIRNPTHSDTSTSTSTLTPTHILRTLLSLNLSPTIYHYTEMARWWAWRAQESKVWIILDRLEDRSTTTGGGFGEKEKDERVYRALSDTDTGALSDTGTGSDTDTGTDTGIGKRDYVTSSELPPPDLPLYIALMRAFISSPNYHGPPSFASPSPSPSPFTSPHPHPHPPPPLLPPFPPLSPYPGTLRRLQALSYIWSRMEKQFGREYLLGEMMKKKKEGKGKGNRYLVRVVDDWRGLARSQPKAEWRNEVQKSYEQGMEDSTMGMGIK
ncbi:hypothetical protein F5050DRAFT_1235293 [Lentinula boryana]|uniref:Uncharacterized protein n=1 Tax=Lentinula boryana TaxID=40481 RepID=A0ABQ8PYI4_9AGAR|nr:hypothetical protein F5050DRAFT_1235293 [Lentinula boryana]